MQLFIKNMVCHRCKLSVEAVLRSEGLSPSLIELGEVTIREDTISPEKEERIREKLNVLGFELLDDKKKRLITLIKGLALDFSRYDPERKEKQLSQYISRKLQHDYSYLSNLFSKVEGVTIEQYVIQLKIEKVKELLIYDELSLNQIAFDLNYSSVAHLSAQFKKLTGLTATQFKALRKRSRKNLDDI